MKYLAWNLDWSNPTSGTGPEDHGRSLGVVLEPGPSVGDLTASGYVIGYGPDDLDLLQFSSWGLRELSQAEALAAALSANGTAHLTSEGKIGFVPPPVVIGGS